MDYLQTDFGAPIPTTSPRVSREISCFFLAIYHCRGTTSTILAMMD